MDDSEKYNGYSPSGNDLLFAGYRLICTCGACPEQYDVFEDATGKQVGYLRLRHGYFRADVPNCGGETVYESQPRGDGVFEEEERGPELVNALLAIHKYLNKE